jgi:phage shock protein B
MSSFFVPFTVLIVLGSLLAGLMIVCWTVVRLVGRGSNRGPSDDEARMIQEMHRGFVRMEQRIEALETLLLEREQGGN